MGLLVATVACGGVYFANSSDETTTEQAQAENIVTTEDMIQQLETDGYLVRNTEEWETEINTVIDTTRQEVEAEFAANTEEEGNEEEENQEEQEEESTESEESEETFLLIIRNGMTSFAVADELIRGNIIEDKQAFVQEAEAQNLAGFIKPGAYEVTSGMTTAQIFEMIT